MQEHEQKILDLQLAIRAGQYVPGPLPRVMSYSGYCLRGAKIHRKIDGPMSIERVTLTPATLVIVSDVCGQHHYGTIISVEREVLISALTADGVVAATIRSSTHPQTVENMRHKLECDVLHRGGTWPGVSEVTGMTVVQEAREEIVSRQGEATI